MLANLWAVVAPVLIVAAIGYGWGRSGRPFDNNFVSPLVTVVGTPCLIFSTMSRIELAPDLLADMALATLVAIAVTGVIAAGLLVLFRQPLGPFLPPLVFANTGNMGLPLTLFAFGQTGLGLGIIHYTLLTVINFTAGQAITAGPRQMLDVFKTPILPSALLGALVAVYHWPVPDWIVNTVHLIGGMTIPMMLMMLGVSLSRLTIHSFGRNLALSVLRLALGAGVGFAVARGLDLPPLAGKVLILQSSMPVAVYNYLFAARFDRRPGDVASLVIISTTLSFLTLPALLWVLMDGPN